VATLLQHVRASTGGKQRRQAAALHSSVSLPREILRLSRARKKCGDSENTRDFAPFRCQGKQGCRKAGTVLWRFCQFSDGTRRRCDGKEGAALKAAALRSNLKGKHMTLKPIGYDGACRRAAFYELLER
jgi:hypothetical protein